MAHAAAAGRSAAVDPTAALMIRSIERLLQKPTFLGDAVDIEKIVGQSTDMDLLTTYPALRDQQ
jgi:hypothetical protein